MQTSSTASFGASAAERLYKLPLGGKPLMFHTELMGMPRTSPLSLHSHAFVVGLFFKSPNGVQYDDPILIRFGAISKNQPPLSDNTNLQQFLIIS